MRAPKEVGLERGSRVKLAFSHFAVKRMSIKFKDGDKRKNFIAYERRESIVLTHSAPCKT